MAGGLAVGRAGARRLEGERGSQARGGAEVGEGERGRAFDSKETLSTASTSICLNITLEGMVIP